jgi:NADH-quinone oxidoreductase subunit H
MIGFEILKLFLIFVFMVNLVPLLVWLERRGSAFMQNRYGPNRVGPLGLVQTLADAVKFAFKEEFVPKKAFKFYFYAAPILALVPAGLALGALPLSLPVKWNDQMVHIQGYNMGSDLVIVLGVLSLSAYSILLAGWSSGNKFSLMGALRAGAQTISYELGLTLSLVGIILVYGTIDLNEITNLQNGPLSFTFAGSAYEYSFLPAWGVFYQPLGALLFLVCLFAESNRLPFDLPEAEAELVSGYHTEYGGLKMLMFYIGEYGHMIVGSALMVILFFGGYNMFFFKPSFFESFFRSQDFTENMVSLLTSVVFFLFFMLKILFFLWVFIWVRWTLPRFRYDQLMDLGWRKILPWGLLNSFVTAGVLLMALD